MSELAEYEVAWTTPGDQSLWNVDTVLAAEATWDPATRTLELRARSVADDPPHHTTAMFTNVVWFKRHEQPELAVDDDLGQLLAGCVASTGVAFGDRGVRNLLLALKQNGYRIVKR